MSGDKSLVNYSVYDQAGNGYVVKVTSATARALYYDSKKEYRLINNLLAQGVKPDYVKKPDFVKNQPKTVAKASVAGSQALDPSPPASGCTDRRATGKKGAEWTKVHTFRLLTVLRSHQETLRKKQIPLSFWQSISDELWVNGLDFSSEQLREKIRNLKRVYSEAKCGKHLGEAWEYFKEMKLLYDVDVQPESVIDLQREEEEGECLAVGNSDTAVKADQNVPSANNSFATIDDVHINAIDLQREDEETECTTPRKDQVSSSSVALKDFSFEGPNSHLINNSVAEDGVHSIVEGMENDVLNISSKLSETAFVRSIGLKSTPEWWRSPPRKVAAKSPTVTANNLRSPHTTPRKTPNRKIAGINWPTNVTELFLNLCIERKECTQLDTVPLRTWKEISEVMLNEGHASCTWQSCRDKFNSLNSFFLDPMLALRGVMSGVKWPYFESFLKIHDIPPNYDAPETANSGENTPSKKGNRMWDDNAIQLLLSLYKEKRHLFKSTKSSIRHDILYRDIASTMQQFDVTVTSKQCKSEFTRLQGIFHTEFDKQGGTGQAPSTWKWYNVFQEMEDGSANLKAPVAFSVGSSTTYLISGESSVPSQRTTRTRPMKKRGDISASTLEDEEVDNLSLAKNGVKPKKKPLYRSWQQEFQEAQLASRRDMIDELKLLREGQERRSEERLATIRSIANQLQVIAGQSKGPGEAKDI